MNILDLRENSGMGGINTELFTSITQWKKESDYRFFYTVLGDQKSGWLFEKASACEVSINLIKCKGPSDLFTVFRIADFISNHHIDIVHTHGYRANFFVRLMMDLRLLSLPTIVTKHGLPVISGSRTRLYYFLDKRPTRLADIAIAVDSYTQKVLIEGWKVPSNKVVRVPNAISKPRKVLDSEIVDIRNSYGLVGTDKVFLFLGRIVREKGVFEIIKAHEALILRGEKIKTFFVGNDGGAKNELSDYIKKKGLSESALIIGTQFDTIPFLSIADAVVLPSYSEGLPYVLLEALAYGRPVIASNVGGISDIVTDGINGCVVPVKDVEKLTQAMFSILEDSGRAKKMGQIGRDYVLTEFSPEAHVSRVSSVYKKVLNSRVEGS